MTEQAVVRPVDLGREAARAIGGLALVLAAAALALRALDAVPRLVTGEHPGVVRYQSIDGAEHALGVRLFVPAFFPDTLRWPPSSIRVFEGPPACAALAFDGHDGESERLLLFQAPGARASIAMALMPSARVLHQAQVDLAVGSATLFRVELADGRTGNDLIWYRPDETVALRYEGAADELVRIAHSLRRRRP